MNYLERIKKHEGLRLKPYKCPAGKLTIGYGRNLEDTGITQREAEMLLQNDLDRVWDEIAPYFNTDEFTHVSRERYHVLVEMAFNLGTKGLLGFKQMIDALRLGDFEEAAVQMLDSKWAEQVGKEPGQRAYVLAEIMRGDGNS